MLVLGVLVAHAENDAGRGGVDIAVFAVCVEHPLIAAVERAHAKAEAARRMYSETWLGRRRYLPGITSDPSLSGSSPTLRSDRRSLRCFYT